MPPLKSKQSTANEILHGRKELTEERTSVMETVEEGAETDVTNTTSFQEQAFLASTDRVLSELKALRNRKLNPNARGPRWEVTASEWAEDACALLEARCGLSTARRRNVADEAKWSGWTSEPLEQPEDVGTLSAFAKTQEGTCQTCRQCGSKKTKATYRMHRGPRCLDGSLDMRFKANR